MTSKISSKTESKISCLEISKQRGYPNNPLPEINKSKEKEITLLRAKKIRMLLSPKEQKIFSVWFYVCDYYYNLGIKYYKKNKGINLSSFTFRDLIKKEGNKILSKINEREFVIALAIEGDLAFDNVRPGTDSYSDTILVGNDADEGSGVLLDMFITGTDFYDSSSSGTRCPTTNQLSLDAFRYKSLFLL